VSEAKHRKTVRSYRLVFRRRWRIFRIQGWRIPLPGGIELRLLGYWVASLAFVAFLSKLPLLGVAVSAAPASLRFLALPLAAAWLLCRWEVDGRPPHRALLGLIAWRLRPRHLAALRRVPAEGTELAPLAELSSAPDLTAAVYPRGRLRGPARLLLRYPVTVEAGPNLWRLRPRRSAPLHSGKTIEVPAGRRLLFEGEPR
jgi:hypothetical protein